MLSHPVLSLWRLVVVFSFGPQMLSSVLAGYQDFAALFDAAKTRAIESRSVASSVEPQELSSPPQESQMVSLKKRAATLPLVISSSCTETIWPAILTQSGVGPPVTGFALDPGVSKSLQVSHDWQGRVWGRTNCSFKSDHDGNPLLSSGRACFTGDCGPFVQCKGTGEIPASLAEFAFTSPTGHAYYDISLVDGYNLGLAIKSLHQDSGVASLASIPITLTNPVCVGNPADSGQIAAISLSAVAQWCPFDLIVNPPALPEGTVYLYPDGTVASQSFDPCFSACGKSGLPQDCCTGAYNDRSKCLPNSYARGAKSVCPDAYSYAFDDQASTFIIPSGGGFEVQFCPPGRSTSILSTNGDELRALAAGDVSSKGLVKREGGHDWELRGNSSFPLLTRRQSSGGVRCYGSARSMGGLRTDSASGISTGGYARGGNPRQTFSWVPFVSIAVAWWMVMDIKKKRALKQGEAERRRIEGYYDEIEAEDRLEHEGGRRRTSKHRRDSRRGYHSWSDGSMWTLDGSEDERALHEFGYTREDLDEFKRGFERGQRDRAQQEQQRQRNAHVNQRGHQFGHDQQPQSILRPTQQFPGGTYPPADHYDFSGDGKHYSATGTGQPAKKREKRVSFSEDEGDSSATRVRKRNQRAFNREGTHKVQVQVKTMGHQDHSTDHGGQDGQGGTVV